MNINIKEFLNQKANATKGEYLLVSGLSLVQGGLLIAEMVKDHKERTTWIGIAKRRWQIAEDELSMYEKKMKKLHGRKYDFTENETYKKLKQETVDTFKVWYLNDIDRKIAKLKFAEVKKRAKLEAARAEVEQY